MKNEVVHGEARRCESRVRSFRPPHSALDEMSEMEETEEMISIAASAPSSVRSICATTSPAQCSSPSNIIALDDDVDLAFARELEDCVGESAAGVPAVELAARWRHIASS